MFVLIAPSVATIWLRRSGTDLLVKFGSFEPLVRQGRARPGVVRHAQIPDDTVDVAGLECRRAVPLRGIDPYAQPGPRISRQP